MKKSEKLKLCNWSLLIMLILTLASGIQLEVTESKGVFPVWLHIIVSTIFLSLCINHIYLHFGWKKWLFKFSKLKSVVSRILWWVTVVTIISAIIAFVHWLTIGVHSPVGGVHGKIGFLMILVAIGHTVKRFAFFKR